MSDEKQPATPSQPPKEPTTAAEHIADQQKTVEAVKQKLTTTDGVVKVVDKIPSIFGLNRNGGNFFGSSSFENTDLNRMLDILDSAVPSELENAGDALQKANEALNKAAKELDEFVRKTDWKGEGATAFQTYSAGLVQHAWDVSKYANTVGAQMKVASTGLTTVRNSKPPRDSRAREKRPEEFPEAEKTPDNPEYQKAVAVEKDRQEAINLMNRLASYYAVSRGTLASQPEPRLPEGLEAAVPRPRSGGIMPGTANRTAEPQASPLAADVSPTRLEEAGSRGDFTREPPGTVMPPRASDTSMVIDSVAPPQSPTAPTGPTTAPPLTGPTGQTNTAPPLVPGIPSNTIKSASKAATGQRGVPRIPGGAPPAAPGRTGQTNGGTPPMGRTATGGRPGIPSTGPTATGRSGEMMGRPTATGGPTGRAGGPSPTGQGPMAGRPTVTGQPGAGRAGTSGPAGPRGRADGIVGGTPQRATTASSGLKVPRGNVIGAEGPAQGRSSAARPGQSGVFGGSAAKPGQRPAAPGTSGRGGVVGTPRDTGRGAPRPGAGGYTTGGAPVLGGRRNQRRPEDEQDNADATRPDYLAEDEETWAARRRPAAPPVIE
jgi:hypothetical protein